MNALLKSVLALCALGAYWTLLRREPRLAVSDRWLLLINFLCKGAVAAVSLGLIYHGSARGDLAEYYLPQAHAALQGHVPDRDFATSYGVLFPYILGLIERYLGLGGWAALLIAADTWLLSRLLREASGARSRVFWIWLTCPLLVWNVPIEAQQQILVAAALCAVLLALEARLPVRAAALLVGSFVTLKVLLATLVPAFVLGVERRVAYRFGMALVLLVAIVGAVHFVLGLNPLPGLLFESRNTFPGSLLFWLWCALRLPQGAITVLNVLSLLAAVSVTALAVRRDRARDAFAVVLIYSLIYLALGPRTYSVYWVIVLPVAMVALCRLGDGFGLLWIASVCALQSAQMSVWFHLGMPMRIDAPGAPPIAAFDILAALAELWLVARLFVTPCHESLTLLKDTHGQ